MAAKTKKAGKKKAKARVGRPKGGGGRRTAGGGKGTKRARKAVARPRPPRQQPESLRLRSVSPSLTVNDLSASLAFYRDVLGFTVKDRWESDGALLGVELVAGSASFWLSQDDWKKGRDRVKGQGQRLYCATAQDVDRLAAGVVARGGRLLEPLRDEPWGGRAFAVADPDGFVITFANET
jgi:uncharacterized glyoxalase superfamily protein PhnB